MTDRSSAKKSIICTSRGLPTAMHMSLLFKNGLGMHIHDDLSSRSVAPFIPKNKHSNGEKHGVFPAEADFAQ
jgi:hypothetical protein